MRGLTTTLARCASAIAIVGGVLLLGGSARAQLSGASVTTTGAGCSGGFGTSEGDCRNSAAFLTNTGSQVSTRYAWNINADSVGGTNAVSGSAVHNLSFSATAPVGYRLSIQTQRVGDMNRISDLGGCNGAVDTSSVTGSSNVALTTGSLSLADPGSIANGTSTTSVPFNQLGAATIVRVSNGVPQSHSLQFTWNGSVTSDSCEVAVRQGESSGTTTGCTACGYTGSPSRTQGGDGHFVTVLFTSLCGNGVIDAGAGEQCDLGGANGAATSCCTSLCQFRASGQTCRTAADFCDAAETCSGSSSACPSDAKVASGTTCRASGGVCDLTEVCDGTNNACPADAKSAAQCRASGGVCDIAESCDGVNDDCPADAKSVALCRASGGGCDIVENCDGSNDDCPADTVQASGFVCNAGSGDACDLDETCDGSSAACPADSITPSGTVCRAGSGDSCDPDETCTGVADATCPADVVSPSGTVCNPGSGDLCDPDDVCPGIAAGTCAADTIAPSGTVCNAGSGDLCDVDEVCSGTADQPCPSDTVAPSSTVCRATAGSCDLAETCTGSADQACPSDQVAPLATLCRADAGQCDVQEVCDGVSVNCPADLFEPDGLPCDDQSLCTENDACSAGVCTGPGRSCIESFKCYKAKDLKNPKFLKQTASLQDQFFNEPTDTIKKPSLICNPVDQNGEGIDNPNDHLTCYKVKGPSLPSRPHVQVVNQLGTTQLELKKTSVVCISSSKTVLP